MTDRELLELAAKAAEIEIWFDDYETPWVDGDKYIWNPLKDDGDALRLAVKLEMDIEWTTDQFNDQWVWVILDGDELSEPCGNDPYAATRRSIVRAAAEIGKEMT